MEKPTAENQEQQEAESGDSSPQSETETQENRPVNINVVLDGEEDIRRRTAKPRSPLKEVIYTDEDGEQFKYFIRKLGLNEVSECYQGQWKNVKIDGEERKILDTIQQAERMIVVAVQKGVVTEARKPLFSKSNVTFMYGGPDSELHSDLLAFLYDEVCKENPTLLQRNNQKAHALMNIWF